MISQEIFAQHSHDLAESTFLCSITEPEFLNILDFHICFQILHRKIQTQNELLISHRETLFLNKQLDYGFDILHIG